MKVDITDDNQFLIINSDYDFELTVLKKEFTKEIPNAWLIKKRTAHVNTERCFINAYGMIPIGLWLHLLQIAKQYNIYMEFTPNCAEYLNSFQLDYDLFKAYVDDMFKNARNDEGNPFKPYEYQIKAAYVLLKYRRACGEISTSAGKTLISFIMFKYLVEVCKIKRMLYIVPSADLALQSAEKYELYEAWLHSGKQKQWTTGILKGGLTSKQKKQADTCTILFGTYQSLCRKSQEYFDEFEALLEDESHHAAAAGSRGIISKCTNALYTFGITGTFPKPEQIENFTIQTYLGPLVYKFTASELINVEKKGTPIYIIFEILNWANKEDKEALFFQRQSKSAPENAENYTLGNKLLKQESEFVNNSYARLKYIGDMAIKIQKNTLVLFGDIKNGYGKKLFEYIKENSEKDVYYIDGNTPTSIRDYYKEHCENDETGQTVLVASIGTFGEGIDLCNLWSIFLVNTAKSERLVRQIVGRGIRKYPGKDKTLIFDFVDDLRYDLQDPRYHDNYMWKHYNERRKIYREQNFPIYEQKVLFQ